MFDFRRYLGVLKIFTLVLTSECWFIPAYTAPPFISLWNYIVIFLLLIQLSSKHVLYTLFLQPFQIVKGQKFN